MRTSGRSPLLFREIVDAIAARRWLLISIVALAVAAGEIATGTLPEQYQSTIRVAVSGPTTASGLHDASTRKADDEFFAAVDLARNQDLHRIVASNLRLDERPRQTRTGYFGRLLDRLSSPPALTIDEVVAGLGERLEVRPSPQSRTVVISYVDSSPQVARAVLEALFDAWSTKLGEKPGHPDAAAALRAKSEEFTRKLNSSDAELAKLGARADAAEPASQKEIVLRQVYDAQDKANSARIEAHELEQRIAVLNTQLAAQPERIETNTVTRYAGAIDKMKEDLASLELQRTQLRQKYAADHRLNQEIDQRIQAAREIIAREEKAPPQEHAVGINEVHRRLTNDLLSAQTALAAAREREKQMTAVTSQYQARMTELDSLSIRKSGIERERGLNEEGYLLFQKKAQQAELQTAMPSSSPMTLSMIDAASPPAPIVWIAPTVRISGLILLGIMFGSGLAWFLEWRNPLIRNAEVTRRKFGLEVLAEIHDA